MSRRVRSIAKSKFTILNEAKFSTDYNAPTYISPILNRINEWAHSTRKETVGDLATIIFPEYIAQSDTHSPSDWKEFYLDNYQENYNSAVKKLWLKFEVVRKAINSVTEQDVNAWLDDFMFYKTFNGLYVQDVILSDIAKSLGNIYAKPTSTDEGRGIDGFIDGVAYSIKPESYKDSHASNIETIHARMVFYRYIYESGSKTKIAEVEYYIEEDEE